MITTFGVTDHRMIWVVIISMVTWLPTFADGQESNVCSYSGQTSERQSALCRNYINMINSGYMLLSNETSLNRGELTSITQGQKESDEMCTFFRSYIHTWEDCCSGWAGPDCTEPICTTACVYGQCTEPDICTCDPGYTGYSCEDTSIGYYNREQYCYGSSTCWGPKAEGFGQERVTMQQCCEASNSNGWGSLGSRCDDCENYSKGISVINQDIDLGYRTCLSFGRSHYRTYDGREYKFPGNCKYVLSADYAGQWEVNVEMVNCETLQTCRKKVTVKFHIGETLELFEGRSFIDDDFMTRLGIMTTDATTFANSWIDDQYKTCPNAVQIPNYCSEENQKAAQTACDVILSDIFIECREKFNYGGWYQMCINEYCLAPAEEKENVLCQELEGFAQECAAFGVVVNWRTSTLCPNVYWEDGAVLKKGALRPPKCLVSLTSTRPQPTYVAHLDLTIKVAFDTCDWTIPETNRYCLSSVIIIYKSTTIIITDTEISVNGQSYPRAHNTYPYRSNDIIIKQATTAFLTVKGFGFFLLYDSHKSLFLTLDRFFMYKVYGLAGTYDDITTNDFETISGSLEVEPHIFADDFKDCIDTSQQYTQSCPSLQQATADYLCDPLLSHPAFATCVAHINSQYFHDKCKLDVCGGKPENAAQIACYWTAAMAGTCAQLGPDYVPEVSTLTALQYVPDVPMIFSTRTLRAKKFACPDVNVRSGCCTVNSMMDPVFIPKMLAALIPTQTLTCSLTNTCDSGTWICDVDNCDMVCPKNQVFQKAISVCEVTCEDIDKSQPCATLLTHDRCACPDNMYKTADGTCVDGSECPCNRFGQLFAPGSIYKESCKTLQRNGASPFNISAQTVPCGSSGIACTRKVTINLYENVTITMMRDAPLEVAGVAVTGDSYSDNLLEISVVFPWISVFVPSLQLAVLWDNGTRLNIRLGTEWTGNVEGLCGTFDNNGNNDFLGQDGMTYSSDNVISFANSWKTNPFCGDVPVDADQSAACSGDLATRADWAEDKCKVIMEGELFSECRTHVSVDPHQYYSDCLFDACGCSSGGDCECMCTAIANFAEACNRAGVSVSWRNPWTCPMMCDGGKVYMSCHSPCHQTCKNIGDEPSNYCVNTPCVEGCFCPDGFVHNARVPRGYFTVSEIAVPAAKMISTHALTDTASLQSSNVIPCLTVRMAQTN
ncbi:SCO-spondin-like [Argopecten irradians]|uniref:SCO-spondin-like n=1 Tax=Argopecten irradians TaxID=31199 RepID=UPI00372092C2